MTHALFNTNDIKDSNNKTYYGHERTLLLAKLNSNDARINADNYEFFAMTQYWVSSSNPICRKIRKLRHVSPAALKYN
jgi:hypothetical protein